MSKANNLTEFLTDIANTIRTKKGTTSTINPQDFSSQINTLTNVPDGYVVIPPKGTALNECGWDAIKFISDNGLTLDWFALGATKTFTMNGQTLTAKLVDTSYQGTEGMVFFCTGLTTNYAMFPNTNTDGGWGASQLRSTLNDTLYNSIQADLKDKIKTVTVKFDLGGKTANTEMGTVQDKLFVPSFRELTGNSNYINSGGGAITWDLNDGNQYAYFVTKPNDAVLSTRYLARNSCEIQRVGFIEANELKKWVIWLSTPEPVVFMMVV